jgi:hypothetical protein
LDDSVPDAADAAEDVALPGDGALAGDEVSDVGDAAGVGVVSFGRSAEVAEEEDDVSVFADSAEAIFCFAPSPANMR